MFETYQGILRGDKIEWDAAAPQPLISTEGVRVEVKLLETPSSLEETRGPRMAAALERIAAGGSIPGWEDPAVWEREVRQDRPLPTRD